MATKTASDLLREVSNRIGELIVVTPTGGTTVTLVDAELNQYWPSDIGQHHVWVYGCADAATANKSVERRARAWTQSSNTLTLFSPGFTDAISSAGTYEIRQRYSRMRVKEAVNSALRLLDMYWRRTILDESIVTEPATWRYQLPDAGNWTHIKQITMQQNDENPTYSYSNVSGLNWTIQRELQEGVEIWWLQFATQPPPDRRLRIEGEGYHSEITYDQDILDFGGRYAGKALEWIYEKAQLQLLSETYNKAPEGETEKWRTRMLTKLMQERQMTNDFRMSNAPTRIVVPGRGDGQRSGPNVAWFGSLSS